MAAGLTTTAVAIIRADDVMDLVQWLVMGQNLSNTRSQPAERQLGPGNVHTLTPRWTFTTGGDVSATPTVAGNSVYFGDWAGNLYAVRADTGKLEWSHSVAEYNGRPGSIVRVSPAIAGDVIIVGDNLPTAAPHDGAHVFAVDRETGRLRWKTTVDQHLAAIITGSPVVNNGVVYIGVSSDEEALAKSDTYPCCTFRGSMAALNANTGALLWKT